MLDSIQNFVCLTARSFQKLVHIDQLYILIYVHTSIKFKIWILPKDFPSLPQKELNLFGSIRTSPVLFVWKILDLPDLSGPYGRTCPGPVRTSPGPLFGPYKRARTPLL
jgi:hypothetical protein